MKVGRRSKIDCHRLCRGTHQPRLVAGVRERVDHIDTDILPDSGLVEEFIEDYPYSPFPQCSIRSVPTVSVRGFRKGLWA